MAGSGDVPVQNYRHVLAYGSWILDRGALSCLGQEAGLSDSLAPDDEETELARCLCLLRDMQPKGHPACSLVIVRPLCQLQDKPKEASLVI